MSDTELRPESYAEHGEGLVDRMLASLRRRKVLPHVTPGAVLVDLGCGYRAGLLRDLAPRLARGVGFDVSVGPNPAPNVELHAHAVDRALPLPDASADVVSCLAVIEHVDHPETLLAESHRVLRPGGVLVVTTPAGPAKPILELMGRMRLIDATEILDHKRYYSPDTLRGEIVRGGFDAAAVDVTRFELGLNLAAVARR